MANHKAENPRAYRLYCRLTAEEKALLSERLPDRARSAFIRRAVLNAMREEGYLDDLPEVKGGKQPAA